MNIARTVIADPGEKDVSTPTDLGYGKTSPVVVTICKGGFQLSALEDRLVLSSNNELRHLRLEVLTAKDGSYDFVRLVVGRPTSSSTVAPHWCVCRMGCWGEETEGLLGSFTVVEVRSRLSPWWGPLIQIGTRLGRMSGATRAIWSRRETDRRVSV